MIHTHTYTVEGNQGAHLEDFHHHLLVTGHIDGLEHLAVLPSAQLPNQLVVVLVAATTASSR